MSLRLTPETLARAYDYLSSTPPFDRWNLPESHDITLRVTRSAVTCADYSQERGRHVIRVSAKLIGHTDTLMGALSHEMIHLFLRSVKVKRWWAHDRAFYKLAARVTKVHGFDPKGF